MELITHGEPVTKNISPDFSWGLRFQEVAVITVLSRAACKPLTDPADDQEEEEEERGKMN